MIQVEMSTASLEQGLTRWNGAVMAGARDGVASACTELLDDTVQDVPTAPVLNTYLRGSASVFVNGILRAVSKHGIPRYLATTSSTRAPAFSIVGETVFNAPYSAQWHENWPPRGRFSDPTAGIHYLSTKLYGNIAKYISTIAAHMRAASEMRGRQ